METSEIIGQSPAMREIFRIMDRVAFSDATVLLSGEPGTGKELLARTLHKNSHRASKPFGPINCRVLPGESLDKELFGHEEASAGGINSRTGLLALADGGTVFFNEVGALDFNLQFKLLRLLQDKEYVRAGGSARQKVNVRVIASSSSHLEKESEKGSFRKDLFYRLNVIPISLPPVRSRGEDILLLAEFFLKKFQSNKQDGCLVLSRQARDLMLRYSWPGNVRELESLMARIALLCQGPEVLPEHFPDQFMSESDMERREDSVDSSCFEWPRIKDMRDRKMNLKDFLEKIEENLLMEAMDVTDGVKNQAAEILGIKRTTLIEKLKKKNRA
jgi:sigma-54 dependent transcriptional regulator, flagellar regulatory protein